MAPSETTYRDRVLSNFFFYTTDFALLDWDLLHLEIIPARLALRLYQTDSPYQLILQPTGPYFFIDKSIN